MPVLAAYLRILNNSFCTFENLGSYFYLVGIFFIIILFIFSLLLLNLLIACLLLFRRCYLSSLSFFVGDRFERVLTLFRFVKDRVMATSRFLPLISWLLLADDLLRVLLLYFRTIKKVLKDNIRGNFLELIKNLRFLFNF